MEINNSVSQSTNAIIDNQSSIASANQKNNSLRMLGVLLLVVIVGLISYYFGLQQGINLRNEKVSTDVKSVTSISPDPTPTITIASPSQNMATNSAMIIYERRESWGPCPPGGEPCSQNTTLYNSGRLVFEGNTTEERNVPKDILDQVNMKIKQSEIVNKDCKVPPMLDYSANYKISLDEQTNTFNYPGCTKELKEIEVLFLEKDEFSQ